MQALATAARAPRKRRRATAFAAAVAVEVVGALVATYAVKGLGGIHALVGAVLGATVVSQVAQAAITVPVESGLEWVLEDDEEEHGEEHEDEDTETRVAESTTAAAVTTTTSAEASSREAPQPPSPPPAGSATEPPPASAPAERALETGGRRRVLSTSLATVSALVATLLVVFGVTVLELGSGHSVIASGDRATTFFSPRDTTPPSPEASPQATGRRLELRFDEQLRAREIDGAGGFVLSAGSEIERVTIDGDLVVLDLGAEPTAASELTLAYHGRSVVDEAGNRAEGFPGLPVVVVPRPPAPVEVRAVQGTSRLSVLFDEPLAPAEGAELLASVILELDDEPISPTAAEIDRDRLVLTLPLTLVLGSRVSIAYSVGDMRPLRDEAGNAVEPFQRSTTVAPDTTAPTVDDIELGDRGLKVVFDEALDASAAVDAASFAVSIDDTPTEVTAASLTDDTLLLELAEPLPAGAEGTVDYTGDALRDAAGNAVASGRLAEFTTPAAAQPALQRAEFSPEESTVALVYDVVLDTTSVPPSTSFEIAVGSELAMPVAVAFDASATTVRLVLDPLAAAVLAQALIAEELASVSYAPGEAPITSAEGATAPAIESRPITLGG